VPELLSFLFLVPFPIPGAGLSHKKTKLGISSNKQIKKANPAAHLQQAAA
jgi:hypothetical protein